MLSPSFAPLCTHVPCTCWLHPHRCDPHCRRGCTHAKRTQVGAAARIFLVAKRVTLSRQPTRRTATVGSAPGLLSAMPPFLLTERKWLQKQSVSHATTRHSSLDHRPTLSDPPSSHTTLLPSSSRHPSRSIPENGSRRSTAANSRETMCEVSIVPILHDTRTHTAAAEASAALSQPHCLSFCRAPCFVISLTLVSAPLLPTHTLSLLPRCPPTPCLSLVLAFSTSDQALISYRSAAVLVGHSLSAQQAHAHRSDLASLVLVDLSSFSPHTC